MATTTPKRRSMKDAAEKVLRDAEGPLHSDEITRRALDRKLIATKGKTPASTMAARLAVDAKKKDSPFIRVVPGTYGLRGRDRRGRKPVPNETADSSAS